VFARLPALGWRAVVPHFRGCPRAPNRLPRAYHSGDHEEIGAMLAAVRDRAGEACALHACGVSLGGSALLNWLGRAGTSAARFVTRAAAVSTPLDLMAAGMAIDRGLNRIYAKHFLQTLKPKALAMAKRFPGLIDPERVSRVRSMWEFDDLVTSSLHGFSGTADYWTRASSKPWLASIAVPTLVLNARNDPFVPGDSLPRSGEVSASVVLEQPDDGGHAGFLTGRATGTLDWLPQRLLSYFASP
jgi:predicted alpha/beta-fold hydrolase